MIEIGKALHTCLVFVYLREQVTLFSFWKCADVFDRQMNCSLLEKNCQCCVDWSLNVYVICKS